MSYPGNLLVVFAHGLLKEKADPREIEQLRELLSQVQTPEQFCIAFELVDRNRVSSKKRKILKEANYFRLRPFRFLISKN